MLVRAAEQAGLVSSRARAWYYRQRLGVKDLDIYFPVFLSPLGNIRLGERVAINAFVHIWANAPVSIGDDTMIASHVQITSSTHDYTAQVMREVRVDREINIGRNVWIGSGSIILPGVSIGDGAAIGAGSVVTKDIPPDTLAFGSPATVRREIARS